MEKSYILNIFNNKQFIIMKKYLIIFVLALCAAVQSNAQATWNVRAGGGFGVSLRFVRAAGEGEAQECACGVNTCLFHKEIG